MDFSSSSEEKLIRESLKKLLESFSSEDYLKKFDSHRYDPALLSELINQGFIVDQDTNKINFDVIKILSEELGYSNSPLNPSALVSDVLITLQADEPISQLCNHIVIAGSNIKISTLKTNQCNKCSNH